MNAAKPFIESTFAAARRALHSARVAQLNVLIWNQRIFMAGEKGANARFMVKHWSDRRAWWLGVAMKERQRAKLLRVAHASPMPLKLTVVR